MKCREQNGPATGYGGAMLAFLLTILSPANAAMVRVQIEGMTCVGCQDKVVGSMDNLAFLSDTSASVASGVACSALDGTLDSDAVTAAIEKHDYTVQSIDIVDTCDPNTQRFPDNWVDTLDLDVAIISRGEAVELSDHQVADKWTIFDFGAPWCAPCHAAEALIKAYLGDHADIAVRAIVLDSQDAKESFSMPAAKQHLMSAAGLPYFVVMSTNGKVVFKGSEVDRMLKKLDKKR
jgi:copper chaperone CopZ